MGWTPPLYETKVCGSDARGAWGINGGGRQAGEREVPSARPEQPIDKRRWVVTSARSNQTHAEGKPRAVSVREGRSGDLKRPRWLERSWPREDGLGGDGLGGDGLGGDGLGGDGPRAELVREEGLGGPDRGPTHGKECHPAPFFPSATRPENKKPRKTLGFRGSWWIEGIPDRIRT